MANHHNHSRDSLPHIRRKQKLELWQDAKDREDVWKDTIIWTDIFSKNYLNSYHEKIILILSNLNNIIEYIMPIKNSLEKITHQVRKGTYFEVWGRLFQVVEMPVLDWWFVDAKEVFPRNPENISLTQSFSLQNVSRNMISDTEAIVRTAQYVSHSLREEQSKYIVYPYMDKDGNMHATMDAVDKANERIHRRNYPEDILDKKFITKIP